MVLTTSEARVNRPWRTAVIAGMASFLDAGAIVGTSTALVLYQGELGLTGNQIGQLSALLTIMIAVGALVGGRLGDLFGRRRVFTVTMIAFALGALMMIFAGSPVMLYPGLVLLGFATGADLPVSMAMIAESAPDDQRGKMITFSHILWMGGILSVITVSIFVGGMGGLGARILYGFLLAVALVVLALRSTLPESQAWQAANETRTASIAVAKAGGTKAADTGAFANLFRSGNVVPLVALGLFYAIANIAANTSGQFGTYLYVNVAHSDVPTASRMALATMAVSILGMFTLMRLVDTRFRMLAFGIGAVLNIAAAIVPAVLGVAVPTLVVMGLLGAMGGAVAGEPMFKVWAQELFSTLYRSSAQGVMIAFTRVVAAAVALVTPAIIADGPQNLFIFLALSTAVACVIGFFWVARLPKAVDDVAAAVTDKGARVQVEQAASSAR